jgi:MtN3 and saliva related transmembrane protein
MTRVTLTTWLGLAAAACTTIAYVPQVMKAWRSKSTSDISLGMFALMVTGIALWLIYGLLLSDLPLIVANAATLCLVAFILLLKLRHG